MDRLRKLYERIPNSVCVDGCGKCCTNMIQFTPSEKNAMGGYDYIDKCPHLINGKCSVYDRRPLICRLYGTSDMFVCEGCTPEKYLSEEETASIIHEYVQIKNEEEQNRR